MTLRIAQLVYTDGRADFLARTLASFNALAPYPFCQRVMIDDSADAAYADALDGLFQDRFHIVHHTTRRGFAGAVQSGWDSLQECDYVFSLEDDFTLNASLDLNDLARVLEWNPQLCQVALLRQSWNEQETRAGGIIQLHPEDYTEHERDGIYWTEHTRHFTTNPNLLRYEITRLGWIQDANSEGHMSFRLRDLGWSFAYFGKKDDTPRVGHIGYGRAEHAKGY